MYLDQSSTKPWSKSTPKQFKMAEN